MAKQLVSICLHSAWYCSSVIGQPWASLSFSCDRGLHLLSYCVFCFLLNIFHFQSVIHFISVAQSYPTLCDPVDCSVPGFPVHHQLPELAQTHIHWVSDAIQPSLLCQPLLSWLQSFPTSGSLFQRVSSSHQVAKVLEFQLQHYSSNEYSGLISFRIEWFDLLAVQGTLKSLLQHHNAKASVLWCSVFFLNASVLTSIHDYWKNHSFDQTDLCWQSDISAF